MPGGIPDGLEGRIIPYLMIDGAAAAIEFYKDAFGATESYRLAMPDGQVGHAEIEVYGARIYLADAPDDRWEMAQGESGGCSSFRPSRPGTE